VRELLSALIRLYARTTDLSWLAGLCCVEEDHSICVRQIRGNVRRELVNADNLNLN